VLPLVRSVGVMGDGRHLRPPGCSARRLQSGWHDRRLGPIARRLSWHAYRHASSTRCRRSTVSSTTSPASRRLRLSGS